MDHDRRSALLSAEQRKQLTELYLEHEEFLVKMVAGRLYAKGLAAHKIDDIVQHVMIVVADQVARGVLVPETVISWKGLFTTIAANQICNELREKQKQPQSLPEVLPSITSGNSTSDDRLTLQKRIDAYKLLPEPLGRLMVMAYEFGMRPGDAAVAAEMRPGDVETALENLLARIQRAKEGSKLKGPGAEEITNFVAAMFPLLGKGGDDE